MQFIKVKTRAFLPPKDDIYKLMNDHLPSLYSGDILIVTSKIVAIHQGRCEKIGKKTKRELAMREADMYLPGKNKYSFLTIKDNAIISSAGVDSSNGRGYYILPPKNPNSEARKIRQFLKKKFKLKKLGVIITDSHSIPLHYGTLGISIGFSGFVPLREYTGRKSVFGAKLKTARSNIVDALAAAGTLLMGEGGEKIPFVIARNTPATFTEKNTYNELVTDTKEDIYRPFLKLFRKPKFDPVRNPLNKRSG
ncbi:MAG: coenzyme F420-0:L-glutamate ligase [Candidatus Doudnabacteria bacterium]|nr:coenzyme F420-0:L-glutamate ligase [bacterium]MDZ4243691.1 coenzyme F420-0:L-glutamate ligase [Candidatus Doudnabacteria bacterium]